MAEPPAWEDPRRVLARHGLSPKRGMSQNFLVSRHAVERIAEAVAPRPGETVIELGPGLGTLTGELLRAGARVIAIERDRDMIAVLREELGDVEALEVKPGDAAEVDLATLAAEAGGPVALAGNLPYAITGAILRNLTGQASHLSRAVLMVQREVRDRLLAAPGTKQWGALTVFTHAVFEITPVVAVPPGAFHPPPKVASAVVKLVPRDQPLAEETVAFRTVVRAIFDARRKTLRRALGQIGTGRDVVDHALAEAEIDGAERGETLDLAALDRLAKAWARATRR